MITREVTLHSGLQFGEDLVKTVTIREEVLGDQHEVLSSGATGQLQDMRILMRRVYRIGPVENPARELVARLSQTDWEIITTAMRKMDLDEAIAAGLVTPDADPAGDAAGGRDQPGGASPGAA